MNKKIMKKKDKMRKTESLPNFSLLFYFFAGFLVLFLPVFHYPKAMDEAMMPRLLVLSFFIGIMTLIVFFGNNYKNLDFSILRQKIFLFLLGFFLITLISIMFAFNYKESFYDIIKTFIMVSVTGLGAVIFLNYKDWREQLIKMIVVAALIALAIGAWQYYFKVIKSDNALLPDGRSVVYGVFGLMFHKNEYSSQLLWMLPFLGYGYYKFRGSWRWLTLITIVMILIMIVLVKTRAVWVGMAVSLFVVAVILIFFARKLHFPLILRNIMAIGMIAGLLGVVVIFSLPKPENRYSLLGRIRSITETTSPDNIHRINIWKTTIEMIKEKPLTGYGAGNWEIHAAYYFDGRFDQVPQLNWGTPHNDYLWIFAEKGILGILLYLLIFGTAIFYQIKILIHADNDDDRMLALLLLAGIVSYLGVSVFNFPYERINHQVFMGLILAASTVLYHQLSERKEYKPARLPFVLPLLAFSIFGVIYGMKTVEQESQLKYALSAYHKENWKVILHYSKLGYNPLKSLDQLSNPPEYYEGLALAKLGRHKEAIVAYEKAYEQFPNNMWIINWMGQSYYQVGRYDEAIECLTKVIKIIPDLREAHISLSATYYKMGDYQNSYDALKAIPGWETDEAIQRNMKVLENFMAQEAAEK